jgi:hypothetical protein
VTFYRRRRLQLLAQPDRRPLELRHGDLFRGRQQCLLELLDGLIRHRRTLVDQNPHVRVADRTLAQRSECAGEPVHEQPALPEQAARGVVAHAQHADELHHRYFLGAYLVRPAVVGGVVARRERHLLARQPEPLDRDGALSVRAGDRSLGCLNGVESGAVLAHERIAA